MLVSVLTPTWNRATYLRRVWKGLNNQSYKRFEWIIANDGSDDDTEDVARELARASSFPVTLINASCHVGKSRMDNEAVKIASGDFIIWCDSDDYLLPQALEVLVGTWCSVPVEERSVFCGVSALCETSSGVLGAHFYEPERLIDLSWRELFYKLGSDHVIFTRAELLKANPFLEVDYLIPESSVWNRVGVLKTRFNPIVLEQKNYGEANCISFSGHMSYNRGKAYAMAMDREVALQLMSWRSRVWRAFNFLRYCFHGEISLKTALKIWGATSLDTIALLLLYPISWLMAAVDVMRGKVRVTHREFIDAQEKVQITINRLNCVG